MVRVLLGCCYGLSVGCGSVCDGVRLVLSVQIVCGVMHMIFAFFVVVCKEEQTLRLYKFVKYVRGSADVVLSDEDETELRRPVARVFKLRFADDASKGLACELIADGDVCWCSYSKTRDFNVISRNVCFQWI